MVDFAEPISELLQFLRGAADGAIDATGKELWLGRAPGTLDVIGGPADYSGALVCQWLLGCGAAVAVQRREDRKLVLTYWRGDAGRAGEAGKESGSAVGGAAGSAGARVELSLDDLYGSGALLPLGTIHGLFAGERKWAARVAGAYWVLAKHRKLTRRALGANIACYSNVPAGAGSSAALEVATLTALTAAYHLILEPVEIGLLAHLVENQIVDRPAGLSDHLAAMLGGAGRLLELQCQPHTVVAYLAAPAGLRFYGLTTGLKANPAARQLRVASAMAHGVIARMYADFGAKKDPSKGYLANIPLGFYHQYLRRNLPARILGSEYLDRYAGVADRAATVAPEVVYFPRSAADYHVNENQRAWDLVEELTAAAKADAATAHQHAVNAGQLLYASHLSYSHQGRLGSPEADGLVRRIMDLGPEQGFFGARSTGSSVAVLATDGADVAARLRKVAEEYQQKTGLPAQVCAGTSGGAAATAAVKMAATEMRA